MSNSETNPQVPPADNSLTPPTSEDINGIPNLGATWVIFNMKYTEGRRKVKKYYNHLKKVNQMYEREERLRTSDHKDWD